MNLIMKHGPITLGDKLAPPPPLKPIHSSSSWLQRALHIIVNFTLLAAISILPVWWLLMSPDIASEILQVTWITLVIIWLFFSRPRVKKARNKITSPQVHSLLANDRQKFMHRLRLDVKTAIFDGSNIYHFGHDNGLDAQPLGMVAHQLRTEGHRIVCFFDSNIFYTLKKHGAFPPNQPHSLGLLVDIFGLEIYEIYVVPSGIQADQYILNSLKHLPISFAVTNDKYRDYVKKFPTVMKGNQWRKGLIISKNEIKLLQHKFQNPIRLN